MTEKTATTAAIRDYAHLVVVSHIPVADALNAMLQHKGIAAPAGTLLHAAYDAMIASYKDEPRRGLRPRLRGGPGRIPEGNATLLDKKVLALGSRTKMVAGAELEAERNRLAWVVAVVDDRGWPSPIERMDHSAYVAGVELAPGKARTAALFKKPSQALEDAIDHGRVAAVTARASSRCRAACPSPSMAR